MKPLGQPVGKRFVRTDDAGYIVGFDYRREGGTYLVRYEDGDLLHFPARELDTYRNYYVHMQNCAPPPERAKEHGNVLFAGFTPIPIRMLLQSTRQEASFSLINCLGETTSSNYVTIVCQLLCQRTTRTACLSTQLNWFCLCAPFFHKVQMSLRFCVIRSFFTATHVRSGLRHQHVETFTETTRAPAQRTQVQPRCTTGWCPYWGRCSARPDTRYGPNMA
jgi:hypothetical protein